MFAEVLHTHYPEDTMKQFVFSPPKELSVPLRLKDASPSSSSPLPCPQPSQKESPTGTSPSGPRALLTSPGKSSFTQRALGDLALVCTGSRLGQQGPESPDLQQATLLWGQHQQPTPWQDASAGPERDSASPSQHPASPGSMLEEQQWQEQQQQQEVQQQRRHQHQQEQQEEQVQHQQVQMYVQQEEQESREPDRSTELGHRRGEGQGEGSTPDVVTPHPQPGPSVLKHRPEPGSMPSHVPAARTSSSSPAPSVLPPSQDSCLMARGRAGGAGAGMTTSAGVPHGAIAGLREGGGPAKSRGAAAAASSKGGSRVGSAAAGTGRQRGTPPPHQVQVQQNEVAPWETLGTEDSCGRELNEYMGMWGQVRGDSSLSKHTCMHVGAGERGQLPQHTCMHACGGR